jgi:hypothetical protein
VLWAELTVASGGYSSGGHWDVGSRSGGLSRSGGKGKGKVPPANPVVVVPAKGKGDSPWRKRAKRGLTCHRCYIAKVRCDLERPCRRWVSRFFTRMPGPGTKTGVPVTAGVLYQYPRSDAASYRYRPALRVDLRIGPDCRVGIVMEPWSDKQTLKQLRAGGG